MVKVKFLFIELSVQDGEREHTQRVLEVTRCKNIDFAAAWYAAHYYGHTSYIERSKKTVLLNNEYVKVNDPVFYQLNSEVAVRVKKCQKLTKREYDVMNRIMY